MLTMYTRILEPPETSFFLFGPRGTGKSTWVDAHYSRAQRFDFLKNDVLLRYIGEPHRLRREVEGNKDGSWVVLDEVQKVDVYKRQIPFFSRNISVQLKSNRSQ